MDFQELADFSTFIHDIKAPRIASLENEKTNAYKLYKGLSSGKYKSREEAIYDIYHDIGTVEKWRSLKHDLKNKLFNAVFILASTKTRINDLRSAHTYTHKQYALVKLLVQFGARKTAMNLAEKIYKIATKYQFTEIQLLLSQILKIYFSLYNLNQKKYNKYSTAYDKAKTILDAEEFVLDCISRQNLLTLKSKTSKIEIEEYFDTKINELSRLKANINSFNFQRSYYTFLVKFAELLPNRLSLLEVSREAVKYFDTVPFATYPVYFTFHLKILKNSILEKDANQATEIFDRYKEKFQNIPNNRFALYYYYLIYNLHLKDYNLSFQLIFEIKNDRNFKKLSPVNIQSSLLLEAYIHFLLNIGKINPSKTKIDPAKIKKFRINKFLNDIPGHSKLKTGSNISILIIHVLHLLQMKKHDAIIDRVEALNQYCYRYLKNDETLRYNCFIKMLIQMTKADFNRIRTIRYSEKLIKRLATAPLDQSGISLETEIIPFEDLWEMVLDLLD